HRYYTTSMKDDPKQMIEEIEAYHHPVRKGRKYPRPLRFQGSVSLNGSIIFLTDGCQVTHPLVRFFV
ncbi:hypothetical protein, partial [Lactobacillus delbrueckii]|uniref:hypothetical protein n=1 Tax=Lactobacillus delbrueckii TaxID=1584 RepID=UPI001CD8DEB8